MILGTSHITNKYVDVNSDDLINTCDIYNNLNKQKIKIILDDVSLNKVTSTKFLGVIIDDKLTWKNHIDAVSKTISRNIGMLTKLKHYVPEFILHSLYCTLVLPYINYGILIWGNTCKTYLNKIHRLNTKMGGKNNII